MIRRGAEMFFGGVRRGVLVARMCKPVVLCILLGRINISKGGIARENNEVVLH
jgi:hypothetical protein